MNKYITEFIGTFFLVFAIGMASLSGSSLAPVAIGSMLMVMVYMGGHISGAHYNPAVTFAILLRGKMEAKDVVPYVIAQIAGSLCASCTVYWLMGKTFAPAPGVDVGMWQALGAEMVLTFALVIVVLNVATAKKTEGNSYYGLAIGFTVMAGAATVGGISGGVFNPAVGTGPMLMTLCVGDGSLQNLWMYWVGPVVGAMAAALAFKLQCPDD
ncbi:MAG: porin [Planctomycetes bacterium]|nr:porin [Planctomycetota bacterium]